MKSTPEQQTCSKWPKTGVVCALCQAQLPVLGWGWLAAPSPVSGAHWPESSEIFRTLGQGGRTEIVRMESMEMNRWLNLVDQLE